ncbi:enolase-phosphatase E1 [Drosophila biarmipes]|uniref:enolase-phosphatase E1 n=1 Tax=Drosophila biarmipes TaxID=125945 RepID=UPI0007E73435|nr:enolase-phosphatase E1 [Drosophila biarmipes]
MKSVIILLALVALCHAAPLDVKESSSETLSRPSPISPDVIVDPKPTEKVILLKDVLALDRQKRNEPKKPDSVKAHELLQHNPHTQKPIPANPHEKAGPQDAKAHEHKHKREAHHEEGHKEEPQKEEVKDAPEVSVPQIGAVEKKKEKREAHQEEGHKEEDKPQVEDLSLPHAVPAVAPAVELAKKKEKREAHHEEGHKEEAKPPVGDLALPHAVPADATTAELPKKQEKRETVEKPDSVKARESLQHGPTLEDVIEKAFKAPDAGKAPEKRQQRDIPVPTQTKATAAPAATTKSEVGSTTPSSHHLSIPHPIPVAELFEKNKHSDKSAASSEESKESKEKAKA